MRVGEAFVAVELPLVDDVEVVSALPLLDDPIILSANKVAFT